MELTKIKKFMYQYFHLLYIYKSYNYTKPINRLGLYQDFNFFQLRCARACSKTSAKPSSLECNS